MPTPPCARCRAPAARLVAAIGERFPGTIVDGAVDREALAAAVLDNPAELAALEAIVHPAVHQERARFIVEHGERAALLFDIPLLFETGGAARSTRSSSSPPPPTCSASACWPGPA